ncbi:MAG: cytochrome P450 [Kibdelosporangium sp.]
MRITLPDGSAAWLVTGYEQVRDGLADPRLSLNKKNSTGGYTGFTLPPALDANLLNMDPPDHTRLRRLAVSAFTRRRTAGPEMYGRIREIADRLLADLSGTVDLLKAYAAPLPVIVIGDILGIPAWRLGEFRRWTDTLMTAGPGTREAVTSMAKFLADLIEAKRRKPADDVISALIAARDGADQLSEDELLSLVFLILWAGYENSVHLIGNSIVQLLVDPRPPDFEDLLRTANPNLHAIRRFPLHDIEFDGVRIPEGQPVLFDIDAANRSSPDRHLSFGAGIHRCLGEPLARLELKVAVAALFGKFSDVRLAVPKEELPWRDSARSRGLLELPVTLTP